MEKNWLILTVGGLLGRGLGLTYVGLSALWLVLSCLMEGNVMLAKTNE